VADQLPIGDPALAVHVDDLLAGVVDVGRPPHGALTPAQTGLDDLPDLGQVGVGGPAVGPGLGRRGGQQLVALAEQLGQSVLGPGGEPGETADLEVPGLASSTPVPTGSSPSG
jgi:hypothetical protein